MSTHHRQGDVLMIKRTDLTIEKLMKDAKLENKDNCVLAEGEATGHAHRAHSAPKDGESLQIFDMGGTRMLYVPETFGTTPVTHEEHKTVHLEPGIHEIRIQREYRDGQVRNVMD